MAGGSAPLPYFGLPIKPKEEEQKNKTKTSYVTNTQIDNRQQDITLPVIATGGVVPYILGRQRIEKPDIIWYGNLNNKYKTETKQETKTDANGNVTIVTTVVSTLIGYTIDIQYAVCLGPNVILKTIYLDNEVVWTGNIGPARTDFVVPNNDTIKDITFAGGAFNQTPDPYIQTIVPEDLSGYVGVAYVIVKGVDTKSLNAIYFEVERFPDGLGMGANNRSGDDINIMTACNDIITNIWGGAGLNQTGVNVDNFKLIGNRLANEGNFCSIINNTPSTPNNLLSILMEQAKGAIYVNTDTNKIECNLIRDNQPRGTMLHLTDRDVINIDQLGKPSWLTMPTSLQVKYTDRSKKYRETPMLAQNLATINVLKKSGSLLSLPAVMTGQLASKLVAREMNSRCSPRQAVNITTNRKASEVKPGEQVVLNVSRYGYYNVVMDVYRIRKQPRTSNTVSLLGEINLYPNNVALFAIPEDTFFQSVDPNPHAPLSVKIMSNPYYPVRYFAENLQDYPGYEHPIAEIPYDIPIPLGEAFNKVQTNMTMYQQAAPDVYSIIKADNALAPGIFDFVYPVVGKLNVAINKYDGYEGTRVNISIYNCNPTFMAELQVIFQSQIARLYSQFVVINDELFFCDSTTSWAVNQQSRTVVITGIWRSMIDTVPQSHARNDYVYAFDQTFLQGRNLPAIKYNPADNPTFKFGGGAYVKNVYQVSKIETNLVVSSYVAVDRANRPYRPHDARIEGARPISPVDVLRGSTKAITWKIRARGKFPANQSQPSQDTDRGAGNNCISYRVMIEDSAAVVWDCGVTSTTTPATSLSITVPAGAAAGVGSLYVQAEFQVTSGTKVSLYKDKLPINLT